MRSHSNISNLTNGNKTTVDQLHPIDNIEHASPIGVN